MILTEKEFSVVAELAVSIFTSAHGNKSEALCVEEALIIYKNILRHVDVIANRSEEWLKRAM